MIFLSVTAAWGSRGAANLEQIVKVMTFGLGFERQNSHVHLGEKQGGSNKSKCKGPGVLSLVCLRNSYCRKAVWLESQGKNGYDLCRFITLKQILPLLLLEKHKEDGADIFPSSFSQLWFGFSLWTHRNREHRREHWNSKFVPSGSFSSISYFHKLDLEQKESETIVQRKRTRDDVHQLESKLVWGIFQGLGSWQEEACAATGKLLNVPHGSALSPGKGG